MSETSTRYSARRRRRRLLEPPRAWRVNDLPLLPVGNSMSKSWSKKKSAAKPAEPLKICRRRQQLLQLGTTESLRVKFVRSSQLGSVHEELHQRRRQVVLGWVLCPDTERVRERSWKKHNRD